MDLDIKRVLAARPGAPERAELAPLVSPWGEGLDPTNVLGEHPRPQMQRDSWVNLNGPWDYAIRESSAARDLWRRAHPPQVWDGQILVPFSPETRLSGVGRTVLPFQLLWYRRTLPIGVPEPGMRVILHFEAVDYACAVYVNATQVTTHVGGYLPFDVDITDALGAGENELSLCVHDPSERGTQPRGKQRINRANLWYTAQSGIWQSVWLEEVPDRHVRSLEAHADADAGTLLVEVGVSVAGDVVALDVLDAAGRVVAQTEAVAYEKNVKLRLLIEAPHLWSTTDPYLYGLRLSYGADVVCGYTAFRTVGIERDEGGMPRFCLNHQPLFVRGVLDQGYWPESLMTAPSDEALVADLCAMREEGFNMVRKHIKVESARWYWHCDRLGMLVWQDMVCGGGLPGTWTSANIPTLFRRTWTSVPDTPPFFWKRFGAGDAAYRTEWLQTAHDTVRLLACHPSIASWVVFNESWGQFESAKMCEALRELDGTRPLVATSGWYDQGAGDFFAVHNYFRGMRVYRDPHAGLWGLGRRSRAFLIDELGGLTCPVAGHTSVATVYGYDTYEDLASWRRAFYELVAQVDALEPEGLSGFVYTQLSDIEEEVNGLLTYDRRVNKLTYPKNGRTA